MHIYTYIYIQLSYYYKKSNNIWKKCFYPFSLTLLLYYRPHRLGEFQKVFLLPKLPHALTVSVLPRHYPKSNAHLLAVSQPPLEQGLHTPPEIKYTGKIPGRLLVSQVAQLSQLLLTLSQAPHHPSCHIQVPNWTKDSSLPPETEQYSKCTGRLPV